MQLDNIIYLIMFFLFQLVAIVYIKFANWNYVVLPRHS